MLLPDLAAKIISEVRKLLDEDIIVVNTEGTIIASTDVKRVGAFHEGAHIASKNRAKLIITENDQTRLQGVKAGINLPIFFQKDAVGVIGITGDPETVSPFGEIIRKMTELIINESYYAEQMDWQARALEGFVFDWLQDKERDHSFFERATFLNVNLSSKRQIAIAEFSKTHSLFHRDVWNTVLLWPEKTRQDIMIRWGNDRAVLLLEVPLEKDDKLIRKRISRFHRFLENTLSTPVSIGSGKPGDPLKLSAAFRQAERALKAARLCTTPVFDEDLTLEMILDDLSTETKVDFVKRTIEPLINEEDLILTLEELFNQNHSLKKTAENLHIHINTLHYRLKKINDLTDLNPGNIKDLFTLYFALRIIDENTKKND